MNDGSMTGAQQDVIVIRSHTHKFCFLLAVLLPHFLPAVHSIDCFKCVSLGGSNPACEDPFHNNYSSTILESPCMAGRKERQGVFPATACIKLAGYYASNGTTVVVRACGLDSGTLTTDTEIIRMSHCGSFLLDSSKVKGCLQSCDDADGCNEGYKTEISSHLLLLLLLLAPLLGLP